MRQAQTGKTWAIRAGGRTVALRLTGLLLLAACGCTFFQDMRDECRYRFTKPDPLVVLDGSTNGVERAWAIRHMDEPAQHGGNQEKQGHYVKILSAIAVSDRDPICRLTAIQTLGRYKDPGAVKALDQAYWEASAFPAETASLVRRQVLTSLGETGNPEARELLVRVARAGAKEDNREDKQRTHDERLAALRALGNYKQYDVTEALYHVLSTEKDVALRDRAHASLVEATGRDLPADPKAWDGVLHGGDNRPATAQNPAEKIMELVGWKR